MRTAACILAAAGLLGVTASVARAQYPQRREGFWIGFGLGYGSANITCGTCGSGPRTGGVTAFLKLGGTPSRNVLIGGAINGWSHSSGDTTETMGNVTASLYYYPAASGFFLTGGLGFSDYSVNTTPSIRGTGWGFTAGAGYDIRVGQNVSLTPVANFVYGGVGDLNVSGGGGTFATGWKQNVVDFGLGVTFH
ncbi:MAG TPA: autotransporter outer membrane beta-barrel domain-containing protein [Gemmatimonadales bacterium]|nr:autotransporter outer membrane beta-barrel domain-containing protein [Gemmatimonadales bacterium]